MSTVIKAGQAGLVRGRLSTVDLADHLAEAKAIIEEAKQQAAQLKARAREEARRVLEEARLTGFSDGEHRGYEDGFSKGRADAYVEAVERFNREQTSLAADFTRVITHIERTKEDIRIAAERDVLDFALGVATKLTFQIGALHREAAQENLRRALELVDDKSDLKIRVHPDDLTAMETFARMALATAGASCAFEVASDESISPGGCVVQGRGTMVDASLETQTEQIAALLLGRGGGHA